MPRPSPTRVLLVSSSDVDALLVRRLLNEQEEDFDLDWVETYTRGLRYIGHGEHDVALIAAEGVEDRSGLDLLRCLEARARTVPVILLTDGATPGADEEALEAGAAGLVERSGLEPRGLRRAIRLALSSRRQLDALHERTAELVGLSRLSSLFLGGSDLPEPRQAAAEELAAATGFPVVCIERHDPELDSLTCVGAFGLPREALGRSWPLRESDLADAVVHARPLIETGPSSASLDLHGVRLGTWVALPLTGQLGSRHAESRALGVVTLGHTEAMPLDSTELHRASALVEHLALLWSRLHVEASPVPRASSSLQSQETSGEMQEELLDPLIELCPAVEQLREELASRGVLLRLRDLGGPRPVGRPGQKRQALRSLRLLTGCLLRSLEPCRAELRILPARVTPGQLTLELALSEPGIDRHCAGGPLEEAALESLQRLAEGHGARLSLRRAEGPGGSVRRVRLHLDLGLEERQSAPQTVDDSERTPAH